ncbi:MAG: hypothetical protein LAO19_00740 [Acidobacteriia bacterium]|nr:hypothetical protein [Terriglobia bacterium]
MATAEHQPGTFKPSFHPLKRVLLNVFIGGNLLFILVWAFPFNARWSIGTRRLIAPYMNLCGLDQSWNLFAPEPQSINAYLVAEITYRDGQTRTWNFPMPQDYGYFRRYFMARRLKWSADNLRLDENAALWPDAARYVARVNDMPDNPPVTVNLVRHWSFIEPPLSGKADAWNQFTFFKYAVLPGDLK